MKWINDKINMKYLASATAGCWLLAIVRHDANLAKTATPTRLYSTQNKQSATGVTYCNVQSLHFLHRKSALICTDLQKLLCWLFLELK